MKILIFTDTHGSESAYKELKKKAKDVDFIICCGDVTIFENDIEKIMKKLSQLGKDVFIIHGNHKKITNFQNFHIRTCGMRKSKNN